MNKYERWDSIMRDYFANVTRDRLAEDILATGGELYDGINIPFHGLRKWMCKVLGHKRSTRKLVTRECVYCTRCKLMWMEE